MNARPAKPTDVFDRLHQHFGIGGFDDIAQPLPAWYEIRVKEAGKISMIARKRKVAFEDLLEIADWLHATGQHLTRSEELFAHYGKWMVAKRLQMNRAMTASAAEAYDVALSQAFEAGDTEYAERLMRASGAARAELVAAWEARS